MNELEFYKAISELGIVVSETMKQQFSLYKDLIQEVNKVLNLTAIDDTEGIYLKHFYDSLLIASFLEEGSSIADIGSGAGFPGLVLAIARPDLKVTCIEPTTKRTNFLSRVCQEANITNVDVVNERAEDIIDQYREHFDYVTARAVAYLDILAELCIPFVKIGGKFIAMKGSKGLEELEASQKAIKILSGEFEKSSFFTDPILGDRYILEVVKTAKSHKKYPRNYAKIKKTPLSGRQSWLKQELYL